MPTYGGSFAGGFINAYLQAKRQAAQNQYYRMMEMYYLHAMGYEYNKKTGTWGKAPTPESEAGAAAGPQFGSRPGYTKPEGAESDKGERPKSVDASKELHATGGANATEMHPAFANRVAALSAEAEKATGQPISFNELYRTYEQQAEIYARHQAMPGGVEKHPAAPPGHSYHEIGAAGDMDDNKAAQWARTPDADGITPIQRHGLETLSGETGRNDPMHIQLPRADWGKTAQADVTTPYEVAGPGDMPVTEAGAKRAAADLAAHRATGNYTLEQMVSAAEKAGFKGQDAAHMAAIAMAESDGRLGAVGSAGELGLTQVNPHVWGRDLANKAAGSLQGSFDAAKYVYDHSRDKFGAWSTDPSSSHFDRRNARMPGFFRQARGYVSAPTEAAPTGKAPPGTAYYSKDAEGRSVPVDAQGRALDTTGRPTYAPPAARRADVTTPYEVAGIEDVPVTEAGAERAAADLAAHRAWTPPIGRHGPGPIVSPDPDVAPVPDYVPVAPEDRLLDPAQKDLARRQPPDQLETGVGPEAAAAGAPRPGFRAGFPEVGTAPKARGQMPPRTSTPRPGEPFEVGYPPTADTTQVTPLPAHPSSAIPPAPFESGYPQPPYPPGGPLDRPEEPGPPFPYPPGGPLDRPEPTYITAEPQGTGVRTGPVQDEPIRYNVPGRGGEPGYGTAKLPPPAKPLEPHIEKAAHAAHHANKPVPHPAHATAAAPATPNAAAGRNVPPAPAVPQRPALMAAPGQHAVGVGRSPLTPDPYWRPDQAQPQPPAPVTPGVRQAAPAAAPARRGVVDLPVTTPGFTNVVGGAGPGRAVPTAIPPYSQPGRYINVQPPGGPPDYGMAPVDITGYPVRGVNAPLRDVPTSGGHEMARALPVPATTAAAGPEDAGIRARGGQPSVAAGTAPTGQGVTTIVPPATAAAPPVAAPAATAPAPAAPAGTQGAALDPSRMPRPPEDSGDAAVAQSRAIHLPDQPELSTAPHERIAAAIDPYQGQVQIPYAQAQPAIPMQADWQPSRPVRVALERDEGDEDVESAARGGPIDPRITVRGSRVKRFQAGGGAIPTSGPLAPSTYNLPVNPQGDLAWATMMQGLSQPMTYQQYQQQSQAAYGSSMPSVSQDQFNAFAQQYPQYFTTATSNTQNNPLQSQIDAWNAENQQLTQTEQSLVNSMNAWNSANVNPASTAVSVPGSGVGTQNTPQTQLFTLPLTTPTQPNFGQSPSANINTGGGTGTNYSSTGQVNANINTSGYNTNTTDQLASSLYMLGYEGGGDVTPRVSSRIPVRGFQGGGDTTSSDPGDVSAASAGPPPGLASAMPQIPPIYFNPATYPASGAPVNKGISTSSMPTYVAAAIPTFQQKGGPIYFQDGGDADFQSDQANFQYATGEGTYADQPAPQAEEASFRIPGTSRSMGFTRGLPAMRQPSLSSGGMRGPRMSGGMMRPRISSAQMQQPDTEGMGQAITEVTGRPPPQQQQGQDQGQPFSLEGGGFGDLFGGIVSGITHLSQSLGLGQPGAVAQSPGVQQARQDFTTGKGVMSDDQYTSLLQQATQEHPEIAQMEATLKPLVVNAIMREYAIDHGDIDTANHYSAAIIEKQAEISSRYSAEALRAFYRGDVNGFLSNLKDGADNVPAAHTVNFSDVDQNGALVSITDARNQQLVSQGRMSFDELTGLAYGMYNKSLTYNILQSEADRYEAGTPEGRERASAARTERSQRAIEQRQQEAADRREQARIADEQRKEAASEEQARIESEALAGPQGGTPGVSPQPKIQQVSTAGELSSATPPQVGGTGAPAAPPPQPAAQAVVPAAATSDASAPAGDARGAAQPAVQPAAVGAPPALRARGAIASQVGPPPQFVSHIPETSEVFDTGTQQKLNDYVTKINTELSQPAPARPEGMNWQTYKDYLTRWRQDQHDRVAELKNQQAAEMHNMGLSRAEIIKAQNEIDKSVYENQMKEWQARGQSARDIQKSVITEKLDEHNKDYAAKVAYNTPMARDKVDAYFSKEGGAEREVWLANALPGQATEITDKQEALKALNAAHFDPAGVRAMSDAIYHAVEHSHVTPQEAADAVIRLAMGANGQGTLFSGNWGRRVAISVPRSEDGTMVDIVLPENTANTIHALGQRMLQEGIDKGWYRSGGPESSGVRVDPGIRSRMPGAIAPLGPPPSPSTYPEMGTFMGP